MTSKEMEVKIEKIEEEQVEHNVTLLEIKSSFEFMKEEIETLKKEFINLRHEIYTLRRN